MEFKRGKRVGLCLVAALALGIGQWALHEAHAQGASSREATAPRSDSGALRLQRSVALFNFKTTAESGLGRGEEIYFTKCWICHNDYTIKAGTGAVPLESLYERDRLVTTGQPVNDQTVADKIRAGSPAMPSYRYTLNDTDMADLLVYLRSEQCCFDAQEPPRNPLYRY